MCSEYREAIVMEYLSDSVIIVIVAQLLFMFDAMMILQSSFWRVVYIAGP